MVRSPIFEMRPSFCLPPVECWSGAKAEPRREVAALGEGLGRRGERDDRGGGDRSDAGDRHEPPRDGVGLGTPGDLTIQLLERFCQHSRQQV
jgi:hypothetical protein